MPRRLLRCQAVFDPEAFDRRCKNPAKFLNDYVTEHNALPTFDMINAAHRHSLKDPGNYKRIIMIGYLSEFETFSRHKALRSGYP